LLVLRIAPSFETDWLGPAITTAADEGAMELDAADA
jgi:hypothetical protein